MSEQTRTGLMTLGAALLLGLLGDRLLWKIHALALGPFLWCAALAGLFIWLARRKGAAVSPQTRWLLGTSLFFAAGWVWRAAPALKLLDLLAAAIALALAVRNSDLRQVGLVGYLLRLLHMAGRVFIGLPFLATHDIRWKEISQASWMDRAAAVARGLLIALPLLLVFGALFAAADAIFDRMLSRLITIAPDALWGHLLITGVLTWVSAGWLRAVLTADAAKDSSIERPASLALGPIEVGTALGLVNALFLTFVLIQLRYFFGGAALVQATTDLIYAEYARAGFFELVTVSGLVLPILLLTHWMVDLKRPGALRLFRWLAGGLVALLTVIMLSALQRMQLYVAEFGLTELRLYSTAFMGWMALLFAWFCWTVLRGGQERFAFGTLLSGFALLALLHALNPDGLIIRINSAMIGSGRPFDAAYATHLSSDAVPALLDTLPRLPDAERREVAVMMLQRWGAPRPDWRSWNWGNARAVSLVNANRHELEQMANGSR